jgi:hypothetical protein
MIDNTPFSQELTEILSNADPDWKLGAKSRMISRQMIERDYM